jgi:predicted ATPase
MGTVHLGEVAEATVGLEPGRKVAVKIVHPHLLSSPGFFKRFLREAELGGKVVHENVVRTFDVDATHLEGRVAHYLVMEYVEGRTIRALLRELDRVPEELCRHIGRAVSRALRAIHDAGVVHRDLKPENLLITKDHEVKVMDLGVARLQDQSMKISQAGGFIGSVLYAAPEQFRSEEPDFRADLYALGLILYELSTGKLPGQADDFAAVMQARLGQEPRPVSELNPQLSPFFEEVVKALLTREPDDRLVNVQATLEQGEEGDWWRERAKSIRETTRRPLRRIRIPRETALYGRDDDLSVLQELYEKAKSGDGQVVLLEGEAGIGKTRLVDEFVGRLRQEGEDLNFLFGSYPPGGAATAAGAFSTAYREHFGEEAIEETLEDYLTVSPLLIPAFSALLRGDAPPTGAEQLNKDSLQTVFVHATRKLAAERPTVVLIDDLHYAPEEGRGVFAALALAVADHRVLLVGTHRRGVADDWLASVERPHHATRRELMRLGPKDLGRLLVDAFQSERLAEELSLKIATRSDGNPFFVFEIIRGLREGRFITRKEDGTWVRSQVIGRIEIPSSVLDLIQARIADLDSQERNLLDIASCCGFEFDPILVGEALGLQRIPLLQSLGVIEMRHRLVRSAGLRYVFDHHQIRQALYEGLSELLRREYHAALGETLEKLDGSPDKDPKDLAGAKAVELCDHLLRGDRGDKALRYLEVALDHLQKGHQNELATELADRALEVEDLLDGKPRVEVLLRKARCLDPLGRRTEQRAALDEALALAVPTKDPELTARARLGLCGFLCSIAEHGEAEAMLAQVLEDARAARARRSEQEATRLFGKASYGLGRYEEARFHFERARELASDLEDTERLAATTIDLGTLFQTLGQYEKGREYQERGLKLAIEAGSRKWEQMATGNLFMAHHRLRQLDKALDYNRRCLALARELGDRRVEAKTIGLQGLILGDMGMHDEVCERCETWLAISREIQDREGEAYALNALGFAYEKLGRDPEAVERYEESRAAARAIGDPQAESYPVCNLGCVHWRQGRYAETLAEWRRFHDLTRGIGNRDGEVNAAANLAMLHLALGDPATAQSMLDDALSADLAKATGSAEGHALRVRGRLAERQGDYEAAVGHFERAIEVAHQGDERHLEGDITLAFGEVLAAMGRTEQAQERLREALASAESFGPPHRVLLARARLALLPGEDWKVAIEALEGHSEDFGPADELEIRFSLWKATGDISHLERAHEILGDLRTRAPEEYRESMIANVPLHREVVQAWEDRP